MFDFHGESQFLSKTVFPIQNINYLNEFISQSAFGQNNDYEAFKYLLNYTKNQKTKFKNLVSISVARLDVSCIYVYCQFDAGTNKIAIISSQSSHLSYPVHKSVIYNVQASKQDLKYYHLELSEQKQTEEDFEE